MRPRTQRPARFDVAPAGAHKFILGAGIAQQAASTNCCLRPSAAFLDQFADDHRRARGDRRAAVRHRARIGLRNFDAIVADAQRIRGNLRENRVRALADFRAGGENAHDSFGRRFHVHDGREIDFSRAGKPRSVHEGSKTDAALDGRAGIFPRETLALGVIVAFAEGAIEQRIEIHIFIDRLVRSRSSRLCAENCAGEILPA